MSFLSPSYFLFFPVAALGYFLARGRGKTLWLLFCSFFFYLCAGAEYMPFLIATVLTAYFGALALERNRSRRMIGALAALFVTVLFLFKYLAFAIGLVQGLFTAAGLDWSAQVPRLLLPAGISFYFFTALGYLIDVYRGRQAAERDFVRCALLIAFFPSLLSGPIGRAEKMLPQFAEAQAFRWENIRLGLLRFLWGAFKKLLLADRLAVVVDTVFAAPAQFGAVQVIAAACAFSVQIYCDFSAYSDMAVGSAAAMGFSVAENFRTPYFSRSIAEFWRRWHISLSSWFRDYLYIPLGGNRKGTARKYLNLLIVFAVSGLWHGAAMTFVIWGVLNGLYQIVGAMSAPARKRAREKLGLRQDSLFTALWQMLWVFALSTAAWVFFESATLSGALAVFRGMLSPQLWVGPFSAMGWDRWEFFAAALSFMLLFAVEALSQRFDVAQRILALPCACRWCFYLALLLAVVIFGSYGAGYNAQEFIYGQF